MSAVSSRSIVTAGAMFVLCMLSSLAADADPVARRDRHDWSAPYRWVHFDNQDSAQSRGFESARKTWLGALSRGDSVLDDGRALIWTCTDGVVHTWITFYPFTQFADLDARREAIRKTHTATGEAALAAYDRGDSALVAPHFTEIWRRSPDDDYVPAGKESLTDRTAGAGFLEWRRADPQSGERVDELWKQIRKGLADAKYPLTCRVYQSVYGQGQWIFFWMAATPEALSAAPTLKTAIHTQRETVSLKLPSDFDRFAPVISRRKFVRRLDLSNL